MPQPLDIQALRNPSPDQQAFVETIGEALDTALENDVQVLQAILWYARVHPNGTQERPEQARKMDFPVDGSDPEKIVDHIVGSYVDRSPGDGFVGRLRIVLQDGGADQAEPLGSFERFVQIGETNHQMGRENHDPYGNHHDPYGNQHLPPPSGMGGYPPAPHMGGGYGPPPPPGYGGGYGAMQQDPMFPSGPMTLDEEIDQEKQGMLLAMSGANERRLDMSMRQSQFLMERIMEINGHYLQTQSYLMQLASHYMNRYQPPPAPSGGGGGGGEQNAMASIIGGLLSMMLGGGDKKAPAPAPAREPQVPSMHMSSALPPQQDAYVPYEPPEGAPMGMDPNDITEDAANEWAQQNPDAAKRVARNLLPTAMQNLIPE